MPGVDLRNYKRCAVTMLIGLALAGCASPYRSGFGRYEGEVRPIVTPVVIRYGPMPRTEGKVGFNIDIRAGRKSQSVRILADGAFGIARMGDRLLATYSIDGITANGKKLDGGLLAGQLLITDRGEIIEASYEADGQVVNPTDSERYSEVETAARRHFPLLPQGPVASGTVLNADDGLIMSAVEQLSDGSMAGEDRPAMTQIMTVRGMTTYQGRDAFVMDIATSGSTKIDGTDATVNAQGFHLLDARSGAYLQSEVILNASLTSGGQTASITVSGFYRADVP